MRLDCREPGCRREAMCAACADAAWSWAAGVAGARGMGWADRVARAGRDRRRLWWPYEGEAAELARRQVDDLTADPALLERLARRCWEEAARRWAG